MTFQSFDSVHPSRMRSAQLFLRLRVGESTACFSLALREREEKRTPLFFNSLKETLHTGSVQSTAHKGKDEV